MLSIIKNNISPKRAFSLMIVLPLLLTALLPSPVQAQINVVELQRRSEATAGWQIYGTGAGSGTLVTPVQEVELGEYPLWISIVSGAIVLAILIILFARERKLPSSIRGKIMKPFHGLLHIKKLTIMPKKVKPG